MKRVNEGRNKQKQNIVEGDTATEVQGVSGACVFEGVGK